ncbi:hypothetical protein M8C21_021290, partial [Ambrosia artemisiifolia]
MMVSRGLFGWSPPHAQPLTPVSEVSEPPESPSPYTDVGNDAVGVEAEDEMEELEEIEPPPAAVPFSKLFVYADRTDWILMVVGSVAAAAHGTALVVYLHYFAKIVQVLVHVDDQDVDLVFDRFKELALTLVYIAGGVFVAGWIEVSCWILTGERQTAVIRSRYVQVLLNQDMSFFDTYGNNGDIVSQVLSDVLLIQSALSEKIGNYIHNMATFFGGLAIGFINCWQIALITLATGPFIVAAGGISNIFLHRLAEYIQDAYAEAAGVAEQAVSYVRTLYAFTNETLAKYSYAASLQATLKYGVSISLVQGLGLGFTYGIAICSCALQLYVGRFLVTHRKAHGGEIVTALFAIILSGLIIPLMERFYDPSLGEVLLDGENIKNLKLEWLRSQIGLVTQEPALLSLSIRDNIAYGRDATSFQIEDAAKVAHAHTFITSLEKGYDTQVGRAGLLLTEEQKIRLSVARAVLSNPSILLLDEVTGGLDFEAERSVQEALDLLMLGRSTIIIARRLSLIKNADFIAVMEDGQLMEIGTHDELIASDGLYAELLRCEEAAKLPRRMPTRNYNTVTAFQLEKDSSERQSFQEPTSPKFAKSPSLQRASNLHASRSQDSAYRSDESPRNPSPTEKENGLSLDGTDKEPSIKRQDSFERRLPELPKLDIHAIRRQTSRGSNPESPISPLLTSDPQSERSHSQTYTRPNSQLTDKPIKAQPVKEKQHKKEPSIWRLIELSLAEWLYAVLGSTGAAIFGSFNPLLAYVISLIVTAYYRNEINRHINIRDDVDKWCLIIACMGIVTVIANFLQHFYFGIMGEKMTERVRRMMFSAMLRNEVGWFDEEENSVDTLSMRLANDATFVRAAFSNRLSILIQDCSAVIVAIVIGMLLHWRLALVALATLPVLTLSAIAQKLWLAGFSKGIQEMHRKASLVLEDAVRNIYTVVAFCA